jgi:DNA-binding transcriptional regulator YdaS (Cro superfamily)
MIGRALLSGFLKRRKMSKAEFAALAGVPGPQVSLWLSRRRPGLISALKIERATEGAVPAASWAPEEVLGAVPYVRHSKR